MATPVGAAVEEAAVAEAAGAPPVLRALVPVLIAVAVVADAARDTQLAGQTPIGVAHQDCGCSKRGDGRPVKNKTQLRVVRGGAQAMVHGYKAH